MAFNGLTNGDFTKAPWASGILTLTDEECVYVIEKCKEVAENFEPSDVFPQLIDSYIISNYNKIDNWEKAINGDTYNILLGYNPEVNTQGIDNDGIVPEPVIEEVPPTEDPVIDPVVEEPVVDGE